MNQVKQTLMGFLIGISLYAVAVELVGIFFSEDLMAYTLGLLFGVIVAILLIVHMAKTLDRSLDFSQEQATKYIKKQAYFRLLFMAVAMSVGLLVDRLNFIALVLGILGLKIGSLIAPFFLRRLYPEQFGSKEYDEVAD